MRKITIAIFIALVVGVFGYWQNIVRGQEIKEKAVPEQALEVIPQRVDSDKNKLFDDLEEIIKDKADTDLVSAIVVFNRLVGDSELESMKATFGSFSPQYTYHTVPGFAAELTKKQIIDLRSDARVKQIEYDAPAILHMDQASKWFGVKKARTDFGLDGNTDGSASYSKDDIVIAVIDTGVDPNHVDLDGGKIIGWKDAITNQSTPFDEFQGCDGHGTHVSSIAAGEGQGNSLYKGVAPGAALVGVRVFKRQGNGCVSSSSAINAGIQWVIDNKVTYGIEVANMSFGVSGCSAGTTSTSLLANSLVDAGVAVFVSAGNEGPAKCTIGSPAAATKVVTVGAMADVNPGTAAAGLPGQGFYLTYFSSRGPTADGRLKPDVSSPGYKITAARAGTTSGYIEYSGTSMSSPFTAGVAGLLLQANPSLTPAQVKNTLASTAEDWDGTGGGTGGVTATADIDYGAGRLDGYEAIKSAGGFSGTTITTPKHQYFTGSLTGTGDADWYDINVVNTTYPLAVTMIMPDWANFTTPDFDMKLYASDGTTQLAVSDGTTRQETIGYQPTATGIYKLRVYSFSGSGNYFFDLSAGTFPPVSITLTTDGALDFGILGLSATKDTTPSGLNDVQTISVDTGPASLDIKSTVFSNNGNSWTLGTTNGADQAKWEFSPTGASWSTFAAANTLHPLASAVSQGSTQNIFFRLTMPTSTSSNNVYSSQIIIVATTP